MALRYRLADWTPDAGPEDEWLARWAVAGWHPEQETTGAWTTVNSHNLKRFSLVRDDANSSDSHGTEDPPE